MTKSKMTKAKMIKPIVFFILWLAIVVFAELAYGDLMK